MKRDQRIFDLIEEERLRQIQGLELIASENFVSDQTREACGSVLTNKYAEGLPGKRFYGGCEVVDKVEEICLERVKKLFGAVWASVQPHSGSQANAAVMLALLEPGDKVLGFALGHGGHLTHGSPSNFSGRVYKCTSYGVERESSLLDWDRVHQIAQEQRPDLIVCGASSYSMDWDYKRLREIADEVGAYLLADISHPSALIAKGLLNNPIPHCHVVTTTTHKTLRGPRGGLILMGQDFEKQAKKADTWGAGRKMSSVLDSGVFPGIQGGPLQHIISAKAVAFGEALTEDFGLYVGRIKENASSLSEEFIARNYNVVSGGTQNHMILVDLRDRDITGKGAETLLGEAGITVNKNLIPFDEKSVFVTSGIRLGTAAVTTRGLRTADMKRIAAYIDEVISGKASPAVVKAEIKKWMSPYPLFQP